MRIIAGKYKGLIINSIKGQDVRPTSDRVREAMFSSLNSICGNIENKRVLDLFGGSGALSFEAISRGCSYAYIFEKYKLAYQNIQKNLNKLNDAYEYVKLFNLDSFHVNFGILLQNFKADLLFLDPPYKIKTSDVFELINKLIDSKKLSNDVIIIYEHKSSSFDVKDVDICVKYNLKCIKSNSYGSTKCSFFNIDC